MDAGLDIPANWEALDTANLAGVLMLVGEPDSGKTTFARYLYQRLVQSGRRAAFLDGDPGQTFLGPPGSVTAAFGDNSGNKAGRGLPFQPGLRISREGITRQPVLRSFIGSTTPARSFLPILVGCARLVEAAKVAQVEAVVYDTDGLVAPSYAGSFLKLNLVDLLHPQVVFAIQKERELEPILAPLRKSRRTKLVELEPSLAVNTRSRSTRRSHRQEMFARFFINAQPMSIQWNRLAVFPAPRFTERQLVGLEDKDGYMLGLGIVLAIDKPHHTLSLLSSWHFLEDIDALRLGELLVDPNTFQDEIA